MTRRAHVPGVPAASAPAAVPAVPQEDLHAAALARRQARMEGRPEHRATTPVPASSAAVAAPAAPAAVATSTAGAPIELLTTTLPIAGMTCHACEVRIARHVGRIAGVERVNASATHGRVEIQSRGPVSRSAVEAAVRQAGYELGATPWIERDRAVWLTAGAGVLLVAAFFVLAQVTGLSGLASGAGDIGRGGVLVALLLGLAAGVSTCMALVGGLVLALSASFEAQNPDAGGLLDRMRPALTFMAGRIIGYAVLGAALGALGASITLPPQVVASLMIVAAVVMTLIGARLTGLSPRVAAWSPTLPPSMARRLGLDDGAVGGYSDGRAAILGVATFFMPCGFTQAVQVYALSTGSPVTAGVIMAVFAIGTAPGLLALAGLPVMVPSKAKPVLLRLIGVVVVGFALINFSAGLRLAGIGLPSIGGTAQAATPVANQTVDGMQVLATDQNADGYAPESVTIYAGTPTRWTITSKSQASCAASLVVPDLGIFQRLKAGDNVVELPAMQAGTLRYSCAMGMYGGEIRIVNRPAG